MVAALKVKVIWENVNWTLIEISGCSLFEIRFRIRSPEILCKTTENFNSFLVFCLVVQLEIFFRSSLNFETSELTFLISCFSKFNLKLGCFVYGHPYLASDQCFYWRYNFCDRPKVAPRLTCYWPYLLYIISRTPLAAILI